MVARKEDKKIDIKIDNLENNQSAEINISASIKEASKDSVRAIMLIRAYRIRGHLIANLDPLSIQKKRNTQNSNQKRMVLLKKITIEKYFLMAFSVFNMQI